MAGNLLSEYVASANLTVTNLHSLAASAAYSAGWTSGTIDNSSNDYEDYHISAKVTMTSSNNQAGEVRVYVYAMLDDSNWPDLFSAGTEGTEGTCTIHDTEQLDSHMRLMWSTAVDTGTGEIHCMPKTGVAQFFGGFCPPKFAIYITGNGATSTNAQFAASGNQVTHAGLHRRYT
jgi:hypothetical protein